MKFWIRYIRLLSLFLQKDKRKYIKEKFYLETYKIVIWILLLFLTLWALGGLSE